MSNSNATWPLSRAILIVGELHTSLSSKLRPREYVDIHRIVAVWWSSERCRGAAVRPRMAAGLGFGLDRSARRDITGVRIQERHYSSRPRRYNP